MPARAFRPLRCCGVAAVVALTAAASGCGSATLAELPPAAAPRDAPPVATAPAGLVVSPRAAPREIAKRLTAPAGRIPLAGGVRFAVVRPRERVVELFDARGGRLGRADAGVGPTRGISNDRWLWVTDTQGDALLVFRVRPKLELVRRVFLPRGPYAVALDTTKLRLWVTLTGTNEVVELPANGRPRPLRHFPTVRQPNAVAVDSRTHRVFVVGRRQLQLLDPGPLPPRD
jgi:hypothetical protein